MGTINSKIEYLEGTKEAIKTAIKDKGIAVSDTDTFRSYATKISQIDGGSSLTFDAIYPVGTIITTANNVNPGIDFGGTWELIDKEFKSEASSSDTLFTVNSNNCELDSCYYTRSNHSIQIRLYFTNKVALSDTTVNLGNFNLENIGVTSLPFGLNNLLGSSDGGNAIFISTLDYSNGELDVIDIIGKNDSIATNSSCRLVFETEATFSRMIDSFCDKFYWKRTV